MTTVAQTAVAEALSALRRHSSFVLDLETTGLCARTDRIIGIAIGVSDDQTWYLDFTGAERCSFTEVMDGLRPILADPTKLWINHNVKFDLEFLLQLGDVEVNCEIADTMIASWLVDETRAGSGRLRLKGKGGLIDEEFDVLLDEWDMSALSGTLPGFGKSAEEYGRDDAKWTWKLWRKMEPKIKRMKLEKVFWEIEMPLVRCLADMEMAGIMVDVPYLRELGKKLQKEADDLEVQIQKEAGFKILVSSPEQISRWLFGPQGPLKPFPWMVRGKGKKGKPGEYSTAEAVLSEYSVDFPVAQMILDWRGRQKLIGTYVRPLIKLATSNSESRIYTSLWQTGTSTGRLASSDPNLQNIPSENPEHPKEPHPLRLAFISPPGFKLVVADYGQLELRIMAHLSQDEKMLDAYATGKDLHQITMDALGVDDRKVGKGLNFGLLYGMGAEGFRKHLWVKSRIRKTLDECTRWRYGFFELYSGLPRYYRKIEEQIRKKGIVYTITGRYRHLKEEMARDENRAYRQGINCTVQGSAADLISIAMRNLRGELIKRAHLDSRWKLVRMILQVHDELIVETPDELADEVVKLVSASMVGVTTLKVPLEAEAHAHVNWAYAKKPPKPKEEAKVEARIAS